MRVILTTLMLLGLASSKTPASDLVETAARNAKQASEALRRSNVTMHAWLKRADPVTGLLPRTGENPNWVIRDSAADLYPFMVLASRFTEPPLYHGAMRDILRREVLQTTRVGRLSDDLQPGGKGFVYPAVDIDRIIFGSSEYVKDGLVPITELLGETPWYHRMRGIASDIIANAPYKSRSGRLPSNSAEINGNMLQLLSRLYWKTGDETYLDQVIAIADFYFLEMLPATGYLPVHLWDFEKREAIQSLFVFSDHGNEIVGGLSEACILMQHKRPDKAKQYREPFVRMIDRVLKAGRNTDGVWVTSVEVPSGKVSDARHAHCWGYMFNAIYTAWIITGDEKYRDAVRRAIDGVTRKPAYLFDETGAGRKWGSNAYSDSIEGALVLLNRLPNPQTDEALDAAVRKFFDRQRPDGIIEDWYGDGNFIRTSLMYAFRKTQGAYVMPWNTGLHVGAVRDGDGLLLHISAELAWTGRLYFDHPRHRDHWNLAVNYPRLNEWPEWFTVEHDRAYRVQIGDSAPVVYLGADLVSGLRLSLASGGQVVVRVKSGD